MEIKATILYLKGYRSCEAAEIDGHEGLPEGDRARLEIDALLLRMWTR